VVEDVELNQYLAKHIMESWGFEVEIAVNGREALEKLENSQYDLILMDIQMPEMDGMEATRRIRDLQNSRIAQIPIVALTANTLKGDSERYKAVGMNDCVPKPIEESRLFEIVSKNLSTVADPQNSVSAQIAQTAAPTENDKLYDLSMVIEISGGDKEFVRKMVQLFLDTMPACLSELYAQTQQQNWEQVGKLAHKLKSTIDSMGIVSLKKDIRIVENNGRKLENIKAIAPLVTRIVTVMEECMDRVKKDFNL
jgi:hypothetical protein